MLKPRYTQLGEFRQYKRLLCKPLDGSDLSVKVRNIYCSPYVNRVTVQVKPELLSLNGDSREFVLNANNLYDSTHSRESRGHIKQGLTLELNTKLTVHV